MTDDERYMRRALDLAALGTGYTSPNPVVGAVIVHSGRLIGEATTTVVDSPMPR